MTEVLSREVCNQLIEKADKKYKESLTYLAPELKEFVGRNPAKVMKKMLECIPEGKKEDSMYNIFSVLTYNACISDITDISDNFWEPISNIYLGQVLDDIDTEWKQKMIDYWMAKLPLE